MVWTVEKGKLGGAIVVERPTGIDDIVIDMRTR